MKEKGRKVKGRTWLPIQLLATPCCECPATPSCYARSPGYSPVHRAFFVWLRNGCREEVIEKWLLNFFIKCSQQLPLHLLCLLENDVEDAHLPLTTSAGVQYFQHNANTVLQQNTRTSDVFTNWLKINIPTFIWSYFMEWRTDSHFFRELLTSPSEPRGPSWLKRMCSENTRDVLKSQLWPRPLGFLREFSFGQIWDRTSCQRRVSENSPQHHNFRAAKQGKLELHSLRDNIVLVWDVDGTREDSENSKTHVGILAYYVLKKRNLFSKF